MDPITHGLIGAASGLAALAATRRGASLRERRIAACCGLIGGELPDADRAIDLWLEHQWADGGGLAYMLYHRGITHSILASLVFAAAIGGVALLFSKIKTRNAAKRGPSSRHEGLGYWPPFLATLVGALLHLAMDATNDYGIHPFFPVSSRWFYGDFLFLGEPLVSAPLLPYLLLALGLTPRYLWPVCLATGAAWFGYGAWSHWLSGWGFVVAFTWLLLHAAGQLHAASQLHVAGHRHAARQHPLPSAARAWAGTAFALGLFFGCSRIAKVRGAEALTALGEVTPPSDIITTPQGANPLCFRVITVTRSGDQFQVRLGVTSLLPALVDPNDCFRPPGGPVPRSVCLERFEPQQDSPFTWLAIFNGSISQFEAWAAQDQRVAATRHFLRAPFWGPDARRTDCARDGALPPGSPKLVIGDMRVDYVKEDLTHFCKYAFVPEPSATEGAAQVPSSHDTTFQPLMPLGAPPFFTAQSAAPPRTLAAKP